MTVISGIWRFEKRSCPPIRPSEFSEFRSLILSIQSITSHLITQQITGKFYRPGRKRIVVIVKKQKLLDC